MTTSSPEPGTVPLLQIEAVVHNPLATVVIAPEPGVTEAHVVPTRNSSISTKGVVVEVACLISNLLTFAKSVPPVFVAVKVAAG